MGLGDTEACWATTGEEVAQGNTVVQESGAGVCRRIREWLGALAKVVGLRASPNPSAWPAGLGSSHRAMPTIRGRQVVIDPA